MRGFDLKKREPSLAAAVRVGFVQNPHTRLRRRLSLRERWAADSAAGTIDVAKRGPASAQGYGSARAGLQSKPAEKEKR
jgi:hypothetical protein